MESQTQALRHSEPVQIEADVNEVCCNGGVGVLGHPAVWYSFDGKNHIECSYCSRVFVKDKV